MSSSDLTPPTTPPPNSPRRCGRCGKDLAEGFASVWTRDTGEVFYCRGDDSPSCYEGPRHG